MRKNNFDYMKVKRLVAVVSSLGLWAISIYFSYQGFAFESTQVLWFGVVLALLVTTVELVFNTKISELNPTLLTAGVICYIYGIYTNVTGFYVLQHGTLEGFFTGTNWLIPIFAGVMSEVLPEALFAWGVGATQDGDFVGNVSTFFNADAEIEQSTRQSYDTPKPIRPVSKPTSSVSKTAPIPHRPIKQKKSFRELL